MWNNLIIFDRKLTESMQTTEIKTHALNLYKLQKSITSYMNEFLNKYELVDFFWPVLRSWDTTLEISKNDR